jgi:hypothetical protein
MSSASNPRSRRGDLRAADLVGRLTVRPAELAVLLGIGETKVRELLPDLPTVNLGGVRVVPIDALRQWLLDRVEVEDAEIPRKVDALIESLTDGRARGADRG